MCVEIASENASKHLKRAVSAQFDEIVRFVGMIHKHRMHVSPGGRKTARANDGEREMSACGAAGATEVRFDIEITEI
jgi:hypothetical protein